MSKKRSFNGLFNLIPSLIILSIAGCAFLGSFVQSDYSAQVNQLQEELTEKQTELERLVTEQKDILTKDTMYYLTGIELMASALEAALTLKEKAELGESTAGENESLLTSIAYYFDLRLWLYEGSNIGTIEKYFTDNPSAHEYVLADQLTKGFDFVITQDDWQSRGIGNTRSMEFILNKYKFPAEIIPTILAHFGHLNIETTQISIQIDKFNDYLQEFVIERQSSLNALQGQIEQLEALISQISSGVALITVATILSTAMVNRISSADASTEMSTIRADILKDNSIIEKKGKKLSILILIGAALLSIGGLVIPILLAP